MSALLRLAPLALALLAVPDVASALEQTIVLNFSGNGACNVCGSTNYACSSGSVGSWNGGNLPFSDPLPSGNWAVTAVSVDVNGALDCGTSGSGALSVSLNGVAVGVAQTPSSSCQCDSCDTETYSGSFPAGNYFFGGTNTVHLTAADDICVGNVELTLTYEAACQDQDGDGADAQSCGGNDCDDFDPDNYPGNTETCDFQDNDCDLLVDEGFDADGDGWTTCDGDCDDGNGNRNPGRPENTAARCSDGIDNDCDLDVDEADSECAPFVGDDDDATGDDDDATGDDDDATGDDDDATGDDDDAVGDDDDDGGGRGGRSGRRTCSTTDAAPGGTLIGLAALLGLAGLLRRRD